MLERRTELKPERFWPPVIKTVSSLMVGASVVAVTVVAEVVVVAVVVVVVTSVVEPGY